MSGHQAARIPAADAVRTASPADAISPRMLAVVLAVTACALLAIHLDRPAFYDNEGRYAAVAREMALSGDPITPRLDGTLFLNKPPLLYWLTALVFSVAGFTEWARIVALAAAGVTLFSTCRLGARLYGERTGLLAGALLATTVGFALEARTLRPDGLLVAIVTTAVLCWHHAEHAAPAHRARWLVALYAVLGAGVLAKGFVPLIVGAIPIGLVTLRAHGWRGLARLRPGLGIAVVAAIALPWHVAVAIRHPGFAWDYVVNQHLLFFFDRKLPRDSEGDPLGFFWGAFLGRSLPWIVLCPLTARELVDGWRGDRGRAPEGTLLLWAWAAGLMLFFSCAPSRLEHYALPALPPVALLAARGWQRLRALHVGRAAWPVFAVAGALTAAFGAVAFVAGPRLLTAAYWIPEVSGLTGLALPGGLTLLAGGVLVATAGVRRRPWMLLGGLAALAVPLIVIVLRAETLAEPLFSWRPVAQALLDAVPPETEIVFEAPEEYQIVGGLSYYTGRRITLLEVPGFVPPPYLQPEVAAMFLPRADLTRRWRTSVPMALVSDPQRRRVDPDGLVDGPFHVLAHFGDRWVLTNFPVAASH